MGGSNECPAKHMQWQTDTESSPVARVVASGTRGAGACVSDLKARHHGCILVSGTFPLMRLGLSALEGVTSF